MEEKVTPDGKGQEAGTGDFASDYTDALDMRDVDAVIVWRKRRCRKDVGSTSPASRPVYKNARRSKSPLRQNFLPSDTSPDQLVKVVLTLIRCCLP